MSSYTCTLLHLKSPTAAGRRAQEQASVQTAEIKVQVSSSIGVERQEVESAAGNP